MNSLEELEDIMEDPVELHPDLQAFMVETAMGPMLKHPLVFSPFHHKLFNGQVNAQYEHKLAAIENMEKEERWYVLPFLWERPHRLEAFRRYEFKMSDEEYWTALGQIWIDSENIWQNEEEWADCLVAAREGRVEHFMDDDDRSVYKTLASNLVVYRGYSRDDRADGLSWTLSEDKARWFANRLPAEGEVPRVIKGIADSAFVLAYFNSRDEDEIVIFPEWVTGREEI